MDEKELEVKYKRLLSLIQTRSETKVFKEISEGNFEIAEKNGWQYLLRLEQDIEGVGKAYNIMISIVLYRTKDSEPELFFRKIYPVEQNTNCEKLYYELIKDFGSYFTAIAHGIYDLGLLVVKNPDKPQERTESCQNTIDLDMVADKMADIIYKRHWKLFTRYEGGRKFTFVATGGPSHIHDYFLEISAEEDDGKYYVVFNVVNTHRRIYQLKIGNITKMSMEQIGDEAEQALLSLRTSLTNLADTYGLIVMPVPREDGLCQYTKEE